MLYIYSLIGKSKVYVHVSGDGDRILAALRHKLGRIKFEAHVDLQGQWWITFGKDHLEKALRLLPERFGEVRLIKEYNTRQKCTTSCQRAYRDPCEWFLPGSLSQEHTRALEEPRRRVAGSR